MKHGLLPTAIPALLLLGLGLWIGSSCSGNPPPPVIGQTDTVQVDNPVLLQMIDELEIERDGWKARFEGIRQLPPRVIVRADTVLEACPAVTYAGISVDRRGAFELGRLDQVEGGYRPSVLHIAPANCDEGLSIGPDGFICNPAQLGHLEIYGAAAVTYPLGFEPELGVSWTPEFRSTFQLDAGVRPAVVGDELGIEGVLRIRKGLRLF